MYLNIYIIIIIFQLQCLVGLECNIIYIYIYKKLAIISKRYTGIWYLNILYL